MQCWTAEPAATDLEITGTPVVELWLEVDAQDAAVVVYLEDVSPDGIARYITEGTLRAACRAEAPAPADHPHPGPYHPCTRAALLHLVPNEPALLRIAMHPTSWLLRRGHRLRLALAGGDRDHLARVPFGQAPMFRVHRGGSMESALLVPVVPR